MKELRRRDNHRRRSRSPPSKQGSKNLQPGKKVERESSEFFRSGRDQCDNKGRNGKQHQSLRSPQFPHGPGELQAASETCTVESTPPTVDISTIDPDNEMAIMKAMGFSGFDSTKVHCCAFNSNRQLLYIYIGKACHRKCT